MDKLEAQKLIGKTIRAFKKSNVIRDGQFAINNERGLNPIELHKREIDPNTKDHEEIKIVKFQNMCDELHIVSKMLRVPVKDLKLYKRFEEFMETSELGKAMTTTNTADWVPDGMSRQLIDLIQIDLMIAKLFGITVVPQGVESLDLPIKTGRSTAYLKSEGSAITESSISDGKVNLLPVAIGDYVQVSDELTEDAAVATMAVVREDIGNVMARAIDDAIVNSDTSVVHQDSDVTLANDHRKAWDGLRRLAIANSYTRSLSTFTSNKITSLVTDMGKYAAAFRNLVFISGVKVQGKTKDLVDANNNRVFTENVNTGPESLNILPGQIGKLGASPYVITEFMREDLNTSGVYDGSVTNNGALLVCRRDLFTRGMKRQMKLETDRNIVSGLNQMVATTRQDFKPRAAIATERIVNYGIDIDIT